MKVIEDEKDRYGKYPIIFPKSATIKDVHEWLHRHYGDQGYKFAMVFDVSKEYEDIKCGYAYFLDEIEDELKAYKE